jgi:hypothetical protein
MHSNTRLTAMKSNAAPLRIVALLCVLLVAVGACAQAVHVHSGSSGLPSYDCSICFVAHSGIIVSALFYPDPVFVQTVLFVPPQAITQSSGFVPSLHIRPPPSA